MPPQTSGEKTQPSSLCQSLKMDAKTLCLGALALGDASGYEIRKLYEEGPLSYIHYTSFGSIYPALNKLLAEGLVSVTEHPQDGRPDKKVYHLTDQGREQFQQNLLAPPNGDRFRSDFLYMLYFSHMLPAEKVSELLDQMLVQYHAYHDDLKSREITEYPDKPPGARFVFNMGLEFYEMVIRFIEDKRQMLENPEACQTKSDTKTSADKATYQDSHNA